MTQCGGFQFLLILDLWGINFHAVVVFALGKNLLFTSVLGHCVGTKLDKLLAKKIAYLLKCNNGKKKTENLDFQQQILQFISYKNMLKQNKVLLSTEHFLLV